MLRGTRYLLGEAADDFEGVVDTLKRTCRVMGYQTFIPSALSEQAVFTDKAGPEVLGQMYSFPDKKGRGVCLVPEITAVVQKLYLEEWSKSLPKPVRICYLARCYRYEKPQAGRYREFWQFGVEHLGNPNVAAAKAEVYDLLRSCLELVGLEGYHLADSVKRGLDYYVEDGFEASVERLGAQKQIAGGGAYANGVGWAIGVDRLLLALEDRK